MVQARLDRATLEIDLNKVDAAKADVAEVLKAVPSSVQAIYLQAAVAVQSLDYQGADALLQLMHRIPAAYSAPGYFLLALVKEQLGQLEQALVAAHAFLAREPNETPSPHSRLWRASNSTNGGPIRSSKRSTHSSRPAAPTPRPFELLGNAYAISGRAELAIRPSRRPLVDPTTYYAETAF